MSTQTESQQEREARLESEERRFFSEASAIRRLAKDHAVQVDTDISAWNDYGVPRVTLHTMIRIAIGHLPVLVETSASYSSQRFREDWAWAEVGAGTCVSFGCSDGHRNDDWVKLHSHANTPHKREIQSYGVKGFLPSTWMGSSAHPARTSAWNEPGFKHYRR